MHQVPREDQLELAEAIAAGAQRRPQAFGAYFSDDGGSCALGAVYDAVYHLPRHGKLIPDHLERLFRCLDEVTKRCPHEGCVKRLPLAPMLVHLNDDHVWTRERIADWLTAESQ